MHKFSYYTGGIKKVTPLNDITIEQAIEMIRGDKFKEVIEKLRTAVDPSVRTVRKSSLDYFTFSGTFKKRNDAALIKHSGILCLDFDDLEDLQAIKEYLVKWDYALAVFTSPSGKGLKVLVKIDPKNHLNTFLELEQVFANSPIPLVLDKSGKDLSRACFVSHDPDLFFDPKSNIYKVKASKPPKKEKPSAVAGTDQDRATSAEASNEIALSSSARFERDQTLKRIAYAVDFIEKNKIDITDNDYDDRRDVGFALSTLGEDAREYYHMAVQFNDAYTKEDADYKFDDALKNSKFKSPGKFFKLCKIFGVPTALPKTLAEKKEEITLLDMLGGNKEQADDMAMYGFFYNELTQTYWSLNEKGKRTEITNFKMKIIYHVETSDEEAYRVIQLKNIFGYDVVVQMNTDDFVSAGSFKKRIARKGNFIFKGTDSDLCRLQDKLQRDERKTDLIKQLGYNRRYNFFAFANGIFDCHLNKFVPVDELGIVEHYELDGDEMKPLNFFIPAMAKMFASKDDAYVNDKRFLYIKSDVQFKDWAALYCKVYGPIGQISLMFYFMALFSDIVFKNMGDRFPLLNVYGQKGTGKGTMIESMMKLFGQGQKQLMLGGASTVVGFMRKSGQYSNGLVWLDEYKNNLKTNFIESLKNLYDRIGYERGKKDNTFQTESTRIDSAVIVSGQEMPIIEEALFSRFIMLVTQKPVKTAEAKKRFDTLKDLEADGLSEITVYLLRHRTLISGKFREAFKAEQNTLYKLVNNHEVDERFINNYAALIAMCTIIKDVETLPFNVSDFRELCKKTLLEQFFVLRGSDSIGKFWGVIENLFDQGIIQEDRHFMIRDSKLYIRVQDVFQFYAEAMTKRKDPTALDESTLKNYLENDPRSFVSREKKFFGGAQRWAFVFKYKEIGINLISAASADELRIKYKALGVEYDEEGTEPAKPGTGEQMAIPLKPDYGLKRSEEFNSNGTNGDIPF